MKFRDSCLRCLWSCLGQCPVNMVSDFEIRSLLVEVSLAHGKLSEMSLSFIQTSFSEEIDRGKKFIAIIDTNLLSFH